MWCGSKEHPKETSWLRSGTPQYRSWSRESLTTQTSLRRRGSRAWKRGLSTGVYLCSEGPMFRGSYVPSFLEKTRNIGPSEHRPFYPLVRSYVPRVLSSEPKAKGRDGLAFFVLDYWDYLLSSSVPVRSQLPVELRLAFNLNNTTHPPGKVEIQLEIDYIIWSVNKWGMVWPTFMRLLG